MTDISTRAQDRRLAGDVAALPALRAGRRPRRRGRWTTPARLLLEGPGLTWSRLVVDGLMVALAVVAASRAPDAGAVHAGTLYALPALVCASLWARGLYRRSVRVMILDRVTPMIGAISVACMTALALDVLLAPDGRPGPLIARVWCLALLLVGTGRVSLDLAQRRARAAGIVARPTLIVGAGHVGVQVARRIEDHPEYGLRPVGFLDADPLEPASGRPPVLGTPGDLREVVADVGAEHVILAFSSAPDRGLVPLIRECEQMGVEVSLVPRLFESVTDRMALERLGGLPLLGLRSVDPKGWQFRLKYGLDRVVAGLAIVLCSPLLAAIAFAVRASSPGPVLFRQRRVGRDGQAFDLLKFRSMRMEAGSGGKAFRPADGMAPGGIEGADRRTVVGRVLRRWSLDELPQLLNVLRGEMSLVGPRPERPEFVELFRNDLDRYADRHRVKSGITGWAQVHGLRGQTSLGDRVEWDNFYIENWSLWLDLKIGLLTLGAVFRPHE